MGIKKTSIALLCLAIAIGITVSCSKTNGTETNVSEQEPAVVKPEQTIEVFGIVRTPPEIIIRADFVAVIDEIYVKTGQRIKRGGPLVRIDLTDYESTLLEKKINLQISELQVEKMENDLERNNKSKDIQYKTITNNIRSAQNDLAHSTKLYEEMVHEQQSESSADILLLRNDLTAAERDLETAKSDYESKQKMFDKGALPATELQKYENIVIEKTAVLQNRQINLENQEQRQQEEIDSLLLSIEKSKLSIENLENQLSELTIVPEIAALEIQKKQFLLAERDYAQFEQLYAAEKYSGSDIICSYENTVVKDVFVSEGSLMNKGQNIISLIDAATTIVEANVPEEFIKDITMDSQPEIKALADSSRIYSGTVIQIAGMAKNNNGMTVVPVLIKVDDNDGFLLPNFNVDIEFVIKTENMSDS